MSAVKLSILIATMPSRWNKCSLLLHSLRSQYLGEDFSENKEVEILVDPSMNYNIGAKRNKLLQQASGEYVVFIDDDDTVSAIYISLILDVCNSKCDCIGINGTITTNGRDMRKWYISKEYANWHTGPDGTYYRTPNHISPVRRKLALQAGFPEVSFAEDAEYSRRLLPLLKTETIITEPIYHYDFWQNK